METPSAALASSEISTLAEVRGLARGVRYFAVAIVLLAGHFGIRCSFLSDSFMQIFQDMLQGKPLPALTQVVFDFRWLLIATAIAIPGAGVISAFAIRSHALALGIMGGAVFLTIMQCYYITSALMAPLFQISSTMGAAQ